MSSEVAVQPGWIPNKSHNSPGKRFIHGWRSTSMLVYPLVPCKSYIICIYIYIIYIKKIYMGKTGKIPLQCFSCLTYAYLPVLHEECLFLVQANSRRLFGALGSTIPMTIPILKWHSPWWFRPKTGGLHDTTAVQPPYSAPCCLLRVAKCLPQPQDGTRSWSASRGWQSMAMGPVIWNHLVTGSLEPIRSPMLKYSSHPGDLSKFWLSQYDLALSPWFMGIQKGCMENE